MVESAHESGLGRQVERVEGSLVVEVQETRRLACRGSLYLASPSVACRCCRVSFISAVLVVSDRVLHRAV